jgi:hypothetical protein
VEEHVQPVRAQVPETAAAGLGGIEHPRRNPRLGSGAGPGRLIRT